MKGWIIDRLVFLGCLGLALSIIGSGEAGALPISIVTPPKTFTTSSPITNYNADTDTFSVVNSPFWVSEMNYISQGAPTFYSSSVTGGAFFSLVADIDETGHLAGGILNLSGGIPDLGITGGTLLLQGTLTDFQLQMEENSTLFFSQFAVGVTYSNPLLDWPEFALVSHSFSVGRGDLPPFSFPPAAVDNLFTASWGGFAPLNTYVGAAVAVPEPSTATLLGLGIAGLLSLSRFKRKP